MAINCEDAAYEIKKTDSAEDSIVVLKGQIDDDSLDITLLGKRRREYGEVFNENLLHILENFAAPEDSSNPGNPDTASTVGNVLENPTAGQFWYNKTNDRIYHWTGLAWEPLQQIGDVAGNSGTVFNGEQIPRPVSSITGYVFPYEECSWVVAPSDYNIPIDYMRCFTDASANVTFEYRPLGSNFLTAGAVNYQIIGIRGANNLGSQITPAPVPSTTPAPTPTPSSSTAASPTPTPTNTPTPTPSTSAGATPTPTPTNTPTPSVTSSNTPTPTPSTSAGASPTPTPTNTPTPTPTSSPTPTPSESPAASPSPTPTNTPTPTPSTSPIYPALSATWSGGGTSTTATLITNRGDSMGCSTPTALLNPPSDTITVTGGSGNYTIGLNTDIGGNPIDTVAVGFENPGDASVLTQGPVQPSSNEFTYSIQTDNDCENFAADGDFEVKVVDNVTNEEIILIMSVFIQYGDAGLWFP